VAIALAAATACLGAVVAYAATRPSGAHHGLAERHPVKHPPATQHPSGSGSGGTGGKGAPASKERLLRPQWIETPPETTTMSDPQFRFNVPPRKPATTPAPAQPGQPPVAVSTRRFQCQLDGGGWSDCGSPYVLTGLAPGSHHLAVRVFNREERVGEATTFDWRQIAPEVAAAPPAREAAETADPMPFSIVALQDPEGLYPGLAPTPIPIRVTNPNDVAIEVIAISAAIGEAPASCAGENFELTPAAVTPEAPLTVPAKSSVELPAAGAEAPAIRMLDLPVEQDACRVAEIPLVFSGEAHG
jgi:hypothetical protein